MKAVYKESGGDAITLTLDERVLERNEQPERVTGLDSIVSGRAWTLRFTARGPGTTWDRALLPPSPQHHEGGPDRFAHYYATDGGVLRMQCFLQVQRKRDGAIATVPLPDDDAPSGTTWYLPACNMARLEHPHHAAQRIARDWFVAPLPSPTFSQVLSFPGSGGPDDAWFVEFVYRSLIDDAHPLASLKKVAWIKQGEEPPGDMFVDQVSVFRRLRRGDI